MNSTLHALAERDSLRALVFDAPVSELPAMIRQLDALKAEAMARGLEEVAKRASDAAHLCRYRVQEAHPAKPEGGDKRSDAYKITVPRGNGDPDVSPFTLRQWRSTYRPFADAESLASRLAESAEPVPRKDLVRPHVAHNSGDQEWYTPADIIERARRLMGGIDLDPASSAVANDTVKAEMYFTAADDGLTQDWHGRVWLNPPYDKPLVAKFVERFLDGGFDAGVILVNNSTDSQWGASLLARCSCVCFPTGRVRFRRPGGVVGAPLQGQMLGFAGCDAESVHAEFREVGPVLTCGTP